MVVGSLVGSHITRDEWQAVDLPGPRGRSSHWTRVPAMPKRSLLIWALLPTAALGVIAGAGCRPAIPVPSAAPAERFAHPESFVVVVDTTEWPHPAGRNAPRYPTTARLRGENARVIVAAIIDSTGHVEWPTVTLLSPPNEEFDRAVCAYFSETRLNWSARRPRRALFVMPFDFLVDGAGPLPPAPDYRELAAQLNAIPRAELVGRLEHERHCP
jgi:TonB family protein